MFEHTTKVVSENLARTVDRRTFLKRASQTTFAGLLALAVGQGWPGRAVAARQPGGGPKIGLQTPVCNPPGPYCNLDGNWQDPNGCHGAHCFQYMYNNQLLQCRVFYQYYQSGCWTTTVPGGSWTCCDCECGTPRITTCGCAQFSGTPQPLPDRPAGSTAGR